MPSEIWGSVPDWISALGNAGMAGAAIAAAWQGILSLSAWRTETIGRRRVELAEEVLADFHQAQDIIRFVRSPTAYGHEYADRPGREADEESIRHHKDTFYVPLKRLMDNAEFFSKMRARRYRVAATFGSEATEPYDKIRRIEADIVTAAQMLMHLDPNRGDDRAVRRQERYEATVWEGSADGTDKIKDELEGIVTAIENRFRAEVAPKEKT